jgi:type I restriction enzyme, S subunit
MSKWLTTTWGDVVTLQRGFDITKNAQALTGSIPVVSSGGIGSYHDQAMTEGPGVIIGRKGTLGRVYFVEGPYWPHDTTLWVRDFKGNDPRFVYYALQCLDVSHMNVGTASPTLNRNHIHPIMVCWPSGIGEQRGIAATLGALDDKIGSNRRVVSGLEKRLLLEFQKVKTHDTVTRKPLSDLVETTKGVSYKSVDLKPSTTSLVTLKSFDRRGGYKPDGLKPYVGGYKPQQVISPGEIVVAQTDLTQGAEVVGRAVRVPTDDSADILVASLDLAIVRPRQVSREYLLSVLTEQDFRQHCRSRTSGTTVLHLDPDAIPSYEAPVASPEIQDAYSQFARGLLELIDCRNRESEQLGALRDTLLPELMSGRIRVPEAQEAVAGVNA